MIIESADGSYETLVKFPDDEVGERWLVRASDGGFAVLVRLSAERSAVPSDRTAFLLRAISAGKASSARVRVPIDRGEFEGRPFAVFPYRFDVSLRGLTAKLHALGRRLAPNVAVAVGVALAEALDAVHDTVDGSGDAMKLVHGGIRSERVRVAFAADVEVDGFGLARPVGAAIPADGDESRFAAPELHHAGVLDTRADVYGVAAVVWELLAARRFDPTLARTSLTKFVPDAPSDLEIVLGSALDPDPANRPPTLDDLANELRNATKTEPAFDLRRLPILAATVVGPEAARAPFVSDPGVSAVLERDLPGPDPASVDAFTRPILPGTPADLVDGGRARSVFGSRAPAAGLSGTAAPGRVSLKKVAVATPNPVAAAPVPGAGNARDRSQRPSAPPPRATKSVPPAANASAKSPAPNPVAAKMPPPPPVPRTQSAPSNPARASAAIDPASAGQPTTPGGFGAPKVPSETSPWVKQGASLPPTAQNRPSAAPPPPPPAAAASSGSGASPSKPPSVVPPPPPSLLAAVAFSPFAPIPPQDGTPAPDGAQLDGLFDDDPSTFGTKPLELQGAPIPAPAPVRSIAPPRPRPLDESIPLRPDAEPAFDKRTLAIVLFGGLLLVALLFGAYRLFGAGQAPEVAQGAPAPVGDDVAALTEAAGALDDPPVVAPAEVPDAGVAVAIDASLAESADAGLAVEGVDAAVEIAAGESDMVFEDAPAQRRAAPMRAAEPPRELSFRERRALRRAERRRD